MAPCSRQINRVLISGEHGGLLGRRGIDDRNLEVGGIVHPLARTLAVFLPPDIVGTYINNAVYLGGGLLLDPAIHKIGLVLATIIAAVAIGIGAVRHRRALPFVVAMTGLSFSALRAPWKAAASP